MKIPVDPSGLTPTRRKELAMRWAAGDGAIHFCKETRKADPAIQTENGSAAAMRAVSAFLRHFDLSGEDAFDVFKRAYNPRCKPPWSEPEIGHMIESVRHSMAEGTRGKRTRRRRKRAGIPRASARRRERVSKRAAQHLGRIWEEYEWPDPRQDSPVPVMDLQPVEQTRLFLRGLFSPKDRIWTGEKIFWQANGETKCGFSGKIRKVVAMFCTDPEAPNVAGRYITPSTFEEGSLKRRKIHVDQHRYIVIESDCMIGREPSTEEDQARNKSLTLAVVRWLCERHKLRLVAIVDSGSKSVHCWFVRPSDRTCAHLKDLCKGLRIDHAGFTSVQPFRVPGVWVDQDGCLQVSCHEKTGRPTRLLYLDPLFDLDDYV